MRKCLRSAVLAVCVIVGSVTTATACPMCAEANKTDENRPRAYMYSILFMMSMPAVIVTGFGIGFYRLHRRQLRDEAAITDESLRESN